MKSHKHQSKVAIVSILSGLIAIASVYFTAAGADFNMAVFTNPKVLLGMTTADVQLLKWSMVCDMFGFYLLLLPAVFYFHQYLKSKTAWSYLLTWCGAAYILVGSIGAGILSVVFPAYITEYPIATSVQQEIIGRNFDLVNQLVYEGMWNTVEVWLAGTWWLGLGIALQKDKPAFGTATIVLGFSCLADGFGNITGNTSMADLGLNFYLGLAIVWPVWLGIQMLIGTRKEQATMLRRAKTKEAAPYFAG